MVDWSKVLSNQPNPARDRSIDDYEVQVAETVEQAKKLGEAGFEHYDTINDRHLYRRIKL